MRGYEASEAGERPDQGGAEQQRQAMEARLQTAENTATNTDKSAGQWVDHGVVNVPVSELPQPEGVQGTEDFHKVSAGEMTEGYRKLEIMRPYIEQGDGRSSDYWRTVDEHYGASYADGYQKVYDAFYGDTAVRLDKVGDEYDIINGRHRIWQAKELSLPSIPAHVIEKQP